MTQKYGKDFSVTALLDKMDFIILPVLNVDGYAYTWTDPVGHSTIIQLINHLSHLHFVLIYSGSRRRSGQIVSTLDPRSSCPGSSPGWSAGVIVLCP